MESRMTARRRALKTVYDEEHVWASDNKAVSRNLAAVNANADLAVIGEAVGPRTLRLSGISYFDPNGNIGATGKYLDAILSMVGYTVYPPRDVVMPDGIVRSTPGRGRTTAYFSDLCPAFPGYKRMKGGKLRIRRPTPELIASALDHEFLSRELKIVKPKVIMLLGKDAYVSVHTRMLNEISIQNLSTVMREITKLELHRYRGALVIPMLHPSPGSPAFWRWLHSSTDYDNFLRRLRSCLQLCSPDSSNT
jgi:uracil-DNA glycosylase